MCEGTQPSYVNLLNTFANPTSAIRSFLEDEKKAARARIKQCDDFLSHKISGILEDAEVRQAIFELRKNFDTDHSSILSLLSLIRLVVAVKYLKKRTQICIQTIHITEYAKAMQGLIPQIRELSDQVISLRV